MARHDISPFGDSYSASVVTELSALFGTSIDLDRGEELTLTTETSASTSGAIFTISGTLDP